MRASFIMIGLSVMSATLTAAPAGVRSIYLNGIDISAAKSQELKNVDITINERGDIFIVAPHYQVHEEDSFIPLSKYVQSMNAPQHKAPQALTESPQTATKVEPAMAAPIPVATPEAQPQSPTRDPNNTAADRPAGLIDKTGDKGSDQSMPPPIATPPPQNKLQTPEQ